MIIPVGTVRYIWTNGGIDGFPVWSIISTPEGIKQSLIGVQVSKKAASILVHSLNTIEESK